MLLTLGLTADAAAAHRHEFSHQPVRAPAAPAPDNSDSSPPPSARGSFPLASSWCPLTAAAASSSSQANGNGAMDDPRQSAESQQEGGAGDHGDGDDDDEDLVENSNSSIAEEIVRKPKRRPRPAKARFQLAHPPPTIHPRQVLHMRPKLLLQLQYLPDAARPTPALDVHPATTFAPRLRRKFPRFFKGKERLGPDDLVVVGSDEYDAPAPDLHGESWDARQPVATIFRVRGDDARTEICLGDGPSWDARRLKTGAYEFVADDGRGTQTTARWVPRKSVDRRQSMPAQPHPDDLRRFHFSLINPQTRRHPILASVTPSSIEIQDAYPVSSASTGHSRPSSAESATRTEDLSARERWSTPPAPKPKPFIHTDEALQTLILITGIWVAFREGWSQTFRYQEDMPAHHHHHHFVPHHRRNVTTPSTAAAAPSRSISTPADLNDNGGGGRASSLQVKERVVRSASGVPHVPRIRRGTFAGAASASAVANGHTPKPTPRRVKSTPETGHGPSLHEAESVNEHVPPDMHGPGEPTSGPDGEVDRPQPSQDIVNGTSHRASNGTAPKPDSGPSKGKRRWGTLRGILGLNRASNGGSRNGKR